MREDGYDKEDEYFDADEVAGMFIMTRPLAGLSQQEKVFWPSLHILSQIYFAILTNTFGILDKYILVGLSHQEKVPFFHSPKIFHNSFLYGLFCLKQDVPQICFFLQRLSEGYFVSIPNPYYHGWEFCLKRMVIVVIKFAVIFTVLVDHL